MGAMSNFRNIIEMKRIYTITTIIMAALAIAGCAKELEENNQFPKEDPKEEPKDDPKVEDGTMVLGAMLPDYPDASDYDAAAQSADTKTTISDNGDKTYSVHWAEGDAISVNGKTSTDIQIGENKKSAQFILPTVDAPYCAVYPAGAASGYVVATSESGNKGEEGYVAAVPAQVTVTVPATQKYISNGIDPNAAIMYAYSESASEPLMFKHAMAYLKLTVAGATIKTIKVNGNHNEMMSGDFILSYNTTENVFVAKNETGKDKPKGNASVKYECGDAGVAAGTPMFIAIPAALYDKGLTLTLVDADNHYQVVKSTLAFLAESGKVYTTPLTFNSNGDYYEKGIYTVEDWNAFVAAVSNGQDKWQADWEETIDGKTGVHLMADIYSSTNLPHPKTEVKWNGKFYGHNNTITHAGYEPLFVYIDTDGVIQDLKVAGNRESNGTDIKATNDWTGSIAVWNYGKIENCENLMEITLSGNNTNAVGICRTNDGSIINCINSGNITISEPSASVYAAGICRTNSGTISGCKNIGTISVSDTKAVVDVAGIVAQYSTGTVTDCNNNGGISVSNPGGAVNAAGIIAQYSTGTLTGCTNEKEGTISITGLDQNCIVAGIVKSVNGTNISNLTNEASLSIDANLTAIRTIYMGGVVANAEYDGVCSKITACKNSGLLSIHKKGKYVMKGGAIGGVVAAINAGAKGTEGSTFTTLNRCSNSGQIKFIEDETGSVHYGYAVGGVIGRCVNIKDVHYLNLGYYTILRETENTGDITVYTANGQKVAFANSGARQTYVGGLAGYVTGVSNADKACVRGKSNCMITVGSALGGDIAGGLVGGGAKLQIDTKPSATTTFKSYEGKPIGFIGAALGWTASNSDIVILDATADATYETGSVAPSAKGFAGVMNGKTITVTRCKYQGASVVAGDIYGNGTKKIN